MPTQEDLYRVFAQESLDGRLVEKPLGGASGARAAFIDYFVVVSHGRSIIWAHVFMRKATAQAASFRRLKNWSDGLAAGDPPSDALLNACVSAAPPCTVAALTVGRDRAGEYASLHHNPLLTEAQAAAFMRICMAQYASMRAAGSD